MKNKKTTYLLALLAISQTTFITTTPTNHLDNKSHHKQSLDIATVNIQEVMISSETGKEIQQRLQDEQAKLVTPLQKEEQAVNKKGQALKELKDKLDKDIAEFEKIASTLSKESGTQKAEALQERAQKVEDEKREFDRLVQKLQTDGQKLQAKLQELYQKEMTKFQTLVTETIKDLAHKHGWDIVMVEESAVYTNPALSKTKEVITEVDKRNKAAKLAKKEALEKAQADKSKSTDKSQSSENHKSQSTDKSQSSK